MKKTLVYFSIAMLFAACSPKISEDCKTSEKKDCVCTMQYDPVCGCDGKTYGNACVAQCAGVKKYTKGECPK